MCVIIDANVASSMFDFDQEQKNLSGKLLLEWVEKGRSVIYGGKLKTELLKVSSFSKWAPEAVKSGRLKEIEEKQIDFEIRKIEVLSYKSNDLHIIALARVSGARLLYSKDENLQTDFKDSKLVKRPRGKIYPGENENQNSIKKFLERNRSICK